MTHPSSAGLNAPSPFDQQQGIPGVKHIIAIVQARVVLKSTVATNLAMALAKSI